MTKNQSALSEEEKSEKDAMDSRMKELFDIFDKDGDGNVSFSEVVLEMYELTNDLNESSKAAVMALMMLDSSNKDNKDDDKKATSSKSMTYEQFCRFLVKITAACYGNMTFDEVADKIIATSKSDSPKLTPDEIYEKFEMDANLKVVLTLKSSSQEQDAADSFQVNRSSKLFDLWDLNGDGYIDFHELALSFRKFEHTAEFSTTTDEAFKILEIFDTDGDKRLDRSEFAVFLVKFANTCKLDFDEMIDFMIVTTALRKNTTEEEKFIKCILS